MENKNSGKKKSGGMGGVLIWIVILMIGALVRNGGDKRTLIMYLVPIALVVLIVAVSTALNKKMQKNGRAPGAATRAAASPAARSYTPEVSSRRAAPRPEPIQVYTDPGDNTDTDRDRQRRRQQLDAFLRNGIIDRKEYVALLKRHERRNG